MWSNRYNLYNGIKRHKSETCASKGGYSHLIDELKTYQQTGGQTPFFDSLTQDTGCKN